MIFAIVLYVLSFVRYCFATFQRRRHLCLNHIEKYHKTISWHFHKVRKTGRRHRPLKPTAPKASDGLHRLPPEIRLQVYRYILPHHHVIQPEFENGRFCARFGLLATSPSDTTHSSCFIRSDGDRTSNALRMILEDGGSFLHQQSPRLPSTKHTAGRLICGDGEAWKIGMHPDFFGWGACTSLIRTSKLAHQEVVDLLYSRHTFSFFGPELLLSFLDRASLEGLRSIKHLHLAVPLPPQAPLMKHALQHLSNAIQRVASETPSLQHLDVEIVVQSGRFEDEAVLQSSLYSIFRQLKPHSLREFVLKFSVLQKKERGKKEISEADRVVLSGAWSDDEYRKLKAFLT